MTIDSDSAKFSQALRSAIFWPLGVFFAATILLVVFIVALLNEVTWSTHSYEVLAHVRKCENLLVDAQNNVRAYLLTGDQSFVNIYKSDRLQQYGNVVAAGDVVVSRLQFMCNPLTSSISVTAA